MPHDIDLGPTASSSTLFRSNTPLTRCLEYVMRTRATAHVRSTIGDDLARVCKGPTDARSSSLLDTNTVQQLVTTLWDKIFSARSSFPPSLCRLTSYMVDSVAQHHPGSNVIPLQAVSAFVFVSDHLLMSGPCCTDGEVCHQLRLFGLAIMWPETFGIVDCQLISCSRLPPPPRALTRTRFIYSPSSGICSANTETCRQTAH